jgi:geranylgeranyl diphosphate synthase type I
MDDVWTPFAERLEAELRRVVAGVEPGPQAWRDAVAGVRALLDSGGKRIRPRLFLLAYLGAGGRTAGDGLVCFAAGIELLHTCMLVHDDVMDGSKLRRGAPTVHELLRERLGRTDDRAARGIAVVLGDVLATLATEALAVVELDPDRCRRARAVQFAAMKDAGVGQLLDLVHGARPIEQVGEDEILEAYRGKTAAFSCRAPLQSGAILAGAGEAAVRAYGEFGLALGTAFQIRDDLVGLLGPDERTGKCSADDVREGKKTLLLRATWERADAGGRAWLERTVGRDPLPEDVERVRALCRDTGAVVEVERRIETLTAAALEALRTAAPLEPWGEQLAALAAWLQCRTE